MHAYVARDYIYLYLLVGATIGAELSIPDIYFIFISTKLMNNYYFVAISIIIQ